MSRQRQFIDIDVLTAAKQRIHHIFDIFDSVAVSFSGGKDSLVVLNLVREVAKERGADKVDAFFYDEEIIPDSVIDFVDTYRREPWVNLLWYCVPLKSTKYILGRMHEYVQWDPGREHVRPMPEWAIRKDPSDKSEPFDQYGMNAHVASRYRGKIAFLTGIRAAESMFRFRACVEKLNENYINASKVGNVSLCKPIYDWSENDVFRFFYERQIKYCPIYDGQVWSGSQLRVATPFHAEGAKHLHRQKTFAPELYDRMMRIFPEMLVQERYYKDLDKKSVDREYGQDFDGVRRWIDENIGDPGQHDLAIKRFESAVSRAKARPLAYPPTYLLKQFMGGSFKRQILPLRA